MVTGAPSATPIPMTEDEALLTLMQWLSPAFPVGGYAYSHGLEAAIASGGVTGADALEAWLGTVIDRGSGRADATLLATAMADGADYAGLNAMARALAASKERWEETITQGRAFAEAVKAVTGRPQPAAALPVALGRAARTLGLRAERVAALYLHAFASNLVSGAVRFMPLGQTEGQRVLAALTPLVLRVAREAARTDPGDIISATPGADMAAMAHETLVVRIFRS